MNDTQTTFQTEYQRLYEAAKVAQAEAACKCPEHDRKYPNDLCVKDCPTHLAAMAAANAISAQFGRDVIELQQRFPGGAGLNPEF